MHGFGVSSKISYILNRFDVAGVWLISLRLLYLYINKYRWQTLNIIWKNMYQFILYCVPFIMLFVSEYDKYNPSLRTRYIITHSIWHITIFIIMTDFLKRFIFIDNNVNITHVDYISL